MKRALLAGFLALTPLANSSLRAQEVELSWSVGAASRHRFQQLFIQDVDDRGNVEVFEFPLSIDPGIELTPRVTLNSHQFFSHEISFTMATGENLRIGTKESADRQNLRIREVGYNLLFNFTRKNAATRPYVLFGPTLSSFRFSDLSVKRSSGVFRFAFENIGGITSAFNSAGVAPLEGGTVFKLGLNYGAGIKFRITRQINLRLDYRGNESSDADFFSRQSLANIRQGITTGQSTGRHRRDVLSIGVGFTM